MKQFYIRNKNDYLKILKKALLVLIIMFLPMIIAFSWKWLLELFGETINEGKSKNIKTSPFKKILFELLLTSFKLKYLCK